MPLPTPVGEHVVGGLMQAVGPVIEKPFRSIVTLSAEIEIAVVLASGTVRFPDNRWTSATSWGGGTRVRTSRAASTYSFSLRNHRPSPRLPLVRLNSRERLSFSIASSEVTIQSFPTCS